MNGTKIVRYQCARKGGCGFSQEFWESGTKIPGRHFLPPCPLCGKAMVKMKRNTK